jgi:hypothetical protein
MGLREAWESEHAEGDRDPDVPPGSRSGVGVDRPLLLPMARRGDDLPLESSTVQ